MMKYATYALSALALASALLAPSAALAYCNGAGSTCVQSNSYSKPYYNSQYASPYANASQYRYAPYSGYYGGGYGYQQPLYFPVYNTTFSYPMSQYGYYQGNYGYSNYGYNNYAYNYGYDYGYDYGGYDYGYNYGGYDYGNNYGYDYFGY